MRYFQTGTLIAAIILVVPGCSRPDSQPAAGTGDSAVSGAPIAGPPRGAWVPQLGALLVVPADTVNAGIVLFPETATPAVASMPITLLDVRGDTVASQVTAALSDSVQCDASIVDLRAGARRPWTIGIQSGRVAPVVIDSIGGMGASDSTSLAATLARLASVATAQQAARFNGLPFIVLNARELELDGYRIVAGHLVRRLNQEASPLEEHTFVIGERPADSTSAQYLLAYGQRSEGSEETVEHFQILGVLRTGATAVLVLTRERAAGTRYELIERNASGVWQLRWARSLIC